MNIIDNELETRSDESGVDVETDATCAIGVAAKQRIISEERSDDNKERSVSIS